MANETQYEYWKLNRTKDIDIFHDSISGVTLTCDQVVRIAPGGADSSARFVQARQFGHIIPATAEDYEAWLQAKWDMDHPRPVVEEKPISRKADSTEETAPANTAPIPTEEELADLTKPELLELIKANKSVTKATVREWEKLSSEEIIPLYLAVLK